MMLKSIIENVKHETYTKLNTVSLSGTTQPLYNSYELRVRWTTIIIHRIPCFQHSKFDDNGGNYHRCAMISAIRDHRAR